MLTRCASAVGALPRLFALRLSGVCLNGKPLAELVSFEQLAHLFTQHCSRADFSCQGVPLCHLEPHYLQQSAWPEAYLCVAVLVLALRTLCTKLVVGLDLQLRVHVRRGIKNWQGTLFICGARVECPMDRISHRGSTTPGAVSCCPVCWGDP
jgi:hypothetical protein